MSKTVHITSAEHFASVIHSSRVVVADFYADWCGPCIAIAPVYEQLSAKLSRPDKITFVKVNTDTQQDIARTSGISAMPTFVIYKGGRETKRIRGADATGLNNAIKQLAQEANELDESGASSSGSGTAGFWTGAAAPRGYAEITDQVDQLGLDFLNLSTDFGSKKAVFATNKPTSLDAKGKGGEEAKDWIESDTDEQLMLYIPFQSTLKLHSLQITSAQSPGSDQTAARPKTLHFYTNRTHVLGFDEAEGMQSTQTIEIQPKDWDAQTHTAKIELRFVKFQNITSLTVFVEDSQGGSDKTRVDRMRLFGETGEKRAMGKLEKLGEDH